MKKKTVFIFSIILTAIIVTSCDKTKPYSLDTGAYGFQKVTITNLSTKEVTEKFFDDIINDSNQYLQWGWLFSFSVGINEDTEFVYSNGNRCFALNEGLAYELIGNNTLKLHFPRFQGYDYDIYDIVIIFGKEVLYG